MGGTEEPHDEELLAAAAAGEEWALTVLYRRHQPALVRFLAGLAGAESEDLAAETWIDAARALHRFDGGQRAFRSLLFTIGRRRAVDHLRGQARRRTDPADPQHLPEQGGPERPDDPAAALLASEGARAAARQIGALLPRAQAEVILLRVVAGLTVAETAEIVGRSPAAVSVLQSRGLARLARRLGAHERHRPGSEDEADTSAQVTAVFRGGDRVVQDPDHPERWES